MDKEDYKVYCHPLNSNEWKKVNNICLNNKAYIICLGKSNYHKKFLQKKLVNYENDIFTLNDIRNFIKTNNNILKLMSKSIIILMNGDLNISEGETIDQFFKKLKEFKQYCFKIYIFSSVPFEYIKAGITCKELIMKKNYYSLEDHFNNNKIKKSFNVMDIIKLNKFLKKHNLKKGFGIIYVSTKEKLNLKHNIEKLIDQYNYKIKVYTNKINFNENVNHLKIYLCSKCNIYKINKKNIIFLLDKHKQTHINRTLNSLPYLCCGKKNNILLYTYLPNIKKYIEWNKHDSYKSKYIDGAFSSNLDKDGNIKSVYFF